MPSTISPTIHQPLEASRQIHQPDSALADKAVHGILHAPRPHWVGDGFPVYGLFGYGDEAVFSRSPFLLLDYAAPTQFAPIQGYRRGVGAHPHRGFETVTIVYDGEVEHRDSTGAGGIIGAGDVQWMTAGSGLIHEEFHSARYSHTGGPFEMVQLWVNLPARHKMTAPRYQAISAQQIPEVPLPDGAGHVRIIAGPYAAPTPHGHGDVAGAADVADTADMADAVDAGNSTIHALSLVHGPASTHTPIHMWDVRLNAEATATLNQPEGWSTLVLVLAGRVRINASSTAVEAAQVAVLSHSGSGVRLRAEGGAAKVLLLAGEPIDEPVVGHGPFVMNSRAEIGQALADFHHGRMGDLHSMPSMQRGG